MHSSLLRRCIPCRAVCFYFLSPFFWGGERTLVKESKVNNAQFGIGMKYLSCYRRFQGVYRCVCVGGILKRGGVSCFPAFSPRVIGENQWKLGGGGNPSQPRAPWNDELLAHAHISSQVTALSPPSSQRLLSVAAALVVWTAQS